jgi:hypothetical protein
MQSMAEKQAEPLDNPQEEAAEIPALTYTQNQNHRSSV